MTDKTWVYEAVPAILIRGAGGEVWVIPCDKLEEFRARAPALAVVRNPPTPDPSGRHGDILIDGVPIDHEKQGTRVPSPDFKTMAIPEEPTEERAGKVVEPDFKTMAIPEEPTDERAGKVVEPDFKTMAIPEEPTEKIATRSDRKSPFGNP